MLSLVLARQLSSHTLGIFSRAFFPDLTSGSSDASIFYNLDQRFDRIFKKFQSCFFGLFFVFFFPQQFSVHFFLPSHNIIAQVPRRNFTTNLNLSWKSLRAMSKLQGQGFLTITGHSSANFLPLYKKKWLSHNKLLFICIQHSHMMAPQILAFLLIFYCGYIHCLG